ncbi:MAG: STAS/SEC14 domain-containing protein [Nannocystaceae bacterium]
MRRLQTTEFEVVEPAFVSVRFHGSLDVDEALAVFDAIDEAVAGESYCLMEAFMTHIEGASPEARRVSAERLKTIPHMAMAVVGGSFAQRMLAKLVLTAVNMIGSHELVAKFFKDSESARAWLREFRAKLAEDGRIARSP